MTVLSSKIVKNIIAPLWAKYEGTSYMRHLEVLEQTQYSTRSEIEGKQLELLGALVDHAYHNVPYYRMIFDSQGGSPGKIQSFDDFAKIPILTKEIIRDRQNELLARNISHNNLLWKKTSGSTGMPLSFAIDLASKDFKRAATIRHNRWANWDLGTRVGAIWGNPPDFSMQPRLWLRNALLERYHYLDTLKMDDMDMERFASWMEQHSDAVLFGHSHSVYLFALFAKKQGYTDIRPKGIVCSAMMLHDFERKEIESVFRTMVTNRYGCEEFGVIASECPHGGLHINEELLYLEVDNSSAEFSGSEGSGALLVTDLTNFGMPFIRYRIGDVSAIDNESCSCGRSLRRLKRIFGRDSDYIRTPGGKYISGISLTENFSSLIPGVKQMQIIQKRIDFILLRIVKDKFFDDRSICTLRKLFAVRFEDGMNFKIEYVESIQNEKSGKYRFVISELLP